jgi:hypothetical protein
MHSFGASANAYLTGADGARHVLLEIPHWDLAWQRDYTFAEPKVFAASDFAGTKLGVQCTFHNPTDHEVFGGYGSDDEMCFDFSLVTAGF